jgi:hypothetical protein
MRLMSGVRVVLLLVFVVFGGFSPKRRGGLTLADTTLANHQNLEQVIRLGHDSSCNAHREREGRVRSGAAREATQGKTTTTLCPPLTWRICDWLSRHSCWFALSSLSLFCACVCACGRGSSFSFSFAFFFRTQRSPATDLPILLRHNVVTVTSDLFSPFFSLFCFISPLSWSGRKKKQPQREQEGKNGPC